MKSKGRTEADFSIVNEPDHDRERALNIRLNGAQGRWDVQRLAELIESSENLQRLSGITDEDLENLRQLDDAMGDSSFLGDYTGERTSDQVQGRASVRNKPAPGDEPIELVFSVDPQQRDRILDVLSTIKRWQGQQTVSEALIFVIDYVADHAEVPDAAQG